MQEIVWSIEWEKKLGTIENVHPTKRSDLMMPYAKSDCQRCGHEMQEWRNRSPYNDDSSQPCIQKFQRHPHTF